MTVTLHRVKMKIILLLSIIFFNKDIVRIDSQDSSSTTSTTTTTEAEQDFFRLPQPEDIFIGSIVTEHGRYSAIVVTGGVVVTHRAVKYAKNITFCNYDKCRPTSNTVFLQRSTGFAYVKIILEPFLTGELQEHVHGEDEDPINCAVHSFKRDTILVSVNENDEVICKQCRTLDALFCRHLFVGALIRQKKKLHVITYFSMFRYAERHVINETQIMKDYLHDRNVSSNVEDATIISTGNRNLEISVYSNASVSRIQKRG